MQKYGAHPTYKKDDVHSMGDQAAMQALQPVQRSRSTDMPHRYGLAFARRPYEPQRRRAFDAAVSVCRILPGELPETAGVIGAAGVFIAEQTGGP